MDQASGYVLIRIDEKASRELHAIVKKIQAINDVKLAHAVTGPYDIIAYVEADNIRALGQAVTNGIRPIEGIKETNTCVSVDF